MDQIDTDLLRYGGNARAHPEVALGAAQMVRGLRMQLAWVMDQMIQPESADMLAAAEAVQALESLCRSLLTPSDSRINSLPPPPAP